MSRYSIPKRLLHLFCGGSAIWLGTTFCSPLAAIDLELPTTPASAPDDLAAPAQTAQQSIVPAASLETEGADHWDTGPVAEDEACEYSYPCGDKYCDDFYGEAEDAYDYAASEESYADEAAADDASIELEDTSNADDFWCDDDACCDEYDYDGYGAEDGEEYADYSYDEEYGYDDEYTYDDAEMNSTEEQSEEVAETPVAENADSTAEDDFSYEFDDYEMYYGYEDDTPEMPEEQDAGQVVDDEADESQWEDYYYEDEYYQDEYASDSQPVTEEMTSDKADAEEAWADEYDYGYDEYEYEHDSYDYDANDMEETFEAGTATDESAATLDESYDYLDPMDQYGHEYEDPYEWQEVEEDGTSEIDLDLLTKQPAELLGDTDCDLIRSMARLAGKPSAVRRVCLNEYIEALGFEAIDFAYRYEDATDSDVLTLADDLPGAAAFLASYRLVEQGDLAMDDGVMHLEGALSDLSLDWIEEVGRIAAAEQALSATHPVVEAMAAVATQSIAGVSALAAAVSERLTNLPWAEVSDRLKEFRSAFRTSEGDDVITF